MKILWFIYHGLALSFFEWAEREIHPQNPDVLKVALRKLHHTEALNETFRA